jgi:hypothetical protein
MGTFGSYEGEREAISGLPHGKGVFETVGAANRVARGQWSANARSTDIVRQQLVKTKSSYENVSVLIALPGLTVKAPLQGELTDPSATIELTDRSAQQLIR